MGRDRLALLLIPLAALGLWFAFASGESNQPVEDARSSDRQEVAAPEPETEPRRSASSERREIEAPTEGEVVVRGVCVDLRDRPLTSVRVSLKGYLAGRRPTPEEREWVPPEDLQTEDDGDFEFRFTPPLGFRFKIELRPTAHEARDAHLDALEPGTIHDLGEIRFANGAKVSGRLVDADGLPVEPMESGETMLVARKERTGSREDPTRPVEALRTVIGDDGRFEIEEVLTLGVWQFTPEMLPVAEGRPGQTPGEFHLDESREFIDLAVVPASEVPILAGIVVDQNDRPVANARVEAQDGAYEKTFCMTDDRGNFTLRRGPKNRSGDPVRLYVEASGCESLTSSKAFAWGDEDVFLQVVRGTGLEIAVRRAADGQPVERFGVWLYEMTDAKRFSLGSTKRRGGWDHEGGLARIPRLKPGRYVVEVDTEDDSPLEGAATIIDFRPDGETRVELDMPPRVQQPIRVVYASGLPVVGSRVELVDLLGIEHDERMRALDRRSGRYSMAERGLLISSAETDADGRVEVSAPEGRPVLLRVTGAHLTQSLEGFLPSATEHVVTIQDGGIVVATVEPQDILDAWYAVLTETRRRQYAPRIYLRSVEGPNRTFPPRRLSDDRMANGTIDPDGNARLSGIPPGRWEVRVQYPDVSVYSSISSRNTPSLAELDVRPGATHPVSLDVSDEREGSATLTVRLNGEPYEGQIFFEDLVEGRSTVRFGQHTSSDGTITVQGSQGAYRVAISLKGGATVPCDPIVQILGGQTARVTVNGSSAERLLRLAREDGESIGRTILRAVRASDGHTVRLWTNGRSETVKFEGPPGAYRISARIRSFGNDNTWREFLTKVRTELGSSATQAAIDARIDAEGRVPLGEVTLGDETDPVELVIPKSWDR